MPNSKFPPPDFDQLDPFVQRIYMVPAQWEEHVRRKHEIAMLRQERAERAFGKVVREFLLPRLRREVMVSDDPPAQCPPPEQK